jgi:diacylglycerol kinase (ATP)
MGRPERHRVQVKVLAGSYLWGVSTVASPGDSWLFLLNPQAGQGKALERWSHLEKVLLSKSFPYQLWESEGPRDLIRLGREAALGKWKRVIVVGGDGSLNEVLNGMLGCGLPADRLPPLSVFPAGSGNDWVCSWRIPHDPMKWLEQAQFWPVQSHGAGEVTFQGTGGKEKRFFAGVCGIGYDGWLTRHIEERPAVKQNRLVYILMTIRHLTSFKAPRAVIRTDGFQLEGNLLSVNAGVVPYSGGGMRLVPHAQPKGTAFAITVIEDMPRWLAVLRFRRAFDGSLGRVKGVHTLTGESLEMDCLANEPVYVEAEGEPLGQCPCSLRFLPGAFRIFAPPAGNA